MNSGKKVSRIISYFVKEDVLYIPLSDTKSSIGDEDYQAGVVLYRDENDPRKVLAIEISNFSSFRENKITISQNTCADFTTEFRELHMLISLRDIMFNDSEQFYETCKEWGISVKILNNKLNESNEINISLTSKNASAMMIAGC